MKPKITLIISFFISLITNGQTPINSFVGKVVNCAAVGAKIVEVDCPAKTS